MTADELSERLLAIMERKVHWAWPGFTSGLVPKSLLHHHFEQEFTTYVRDFPVLVARAYVQCPIAAARRELVKNVYEEETGGLAAGRPHPELFLEYPRGLGMDLARFERVNLLPGARRYRDTIDRWTQGHGWEVAAAVTTLFIEGTPYERGEIDASAEKRPTPPLSEHPLVRHYGLSEAHLALTKAHRGVEGEHRRAAWRIVLEHVGAAAYPTVLEGMNVMLRDWLSYRDDVAAAVGLKQGPGGAPVRA